MRRTLVLTLLVTTSLVYGQKLGIPDQKLAVEPLGVSEIRVWGTPQPQPSSSNPVVSTAVSSLANPRATGGLEARGKVVLNANAGTGGVMVQLASSHPSLAPVQNLTVPAGSREKEFSILTRPVAADTPVEISAHHHTSDRKVTTLTVVPTALSKVELAKTSAISGEMLEGRAIFTGPPAPGMAVKPSLTSVSPNILTVPSTATLEQNRNVATFTVKTLGVGADTVAGVSASWKDITRRGDLTVKPAALTGFDTVYNDKYCGAPCAKTIDATLNGEAPPEGAVIQVSTNKPSVVTVPATIIVPAGQRIAPLTFSVASASTSSANVSASYRGVTKTFSFEITPEDKHDLVIETTSLKDQYGNPIGAPQDAYPTQLCIKVNLCNNDKCGESQPPVTQLSVSWKKGTIGRTWNVPVDFAQPNSSGWSMNRTVCTEMPGIQPGESLAVTLKADATNLINERSESNNGKTLTLARP